MAIRSLSGRFKPIWILLVAYFQTQVGATEIEDGFIRCFGNDASKLKCWETARVWMFEAGMPNLKKFCATAHKLAGLGEVEVEVAFLRAITLSFSTTQYPSRRIIVAAYGPIHPGAKDGVLDREYWYSKKPQPFYLTEGQRPDCAYIVSRQGAIDGSVRLHQHVCGIHIEEKSS